MFFEKETSTDFEIDIIHEQFEQVFKGILKEMKIEIQRGSKSKILKCFVLDQELII